MTIPIRLRLTLISAGLMAAVLVALAAFLVTRLEADLIATVDAGLRSRASVLLDRIGEGGGVSSSSLSEGDEAFAQLLASDGSIVVSSSGVTDPMLSPDEVSAVERVEFLDRTVETGEEPVEGRLLVTRTGDGDVLVVGASLEDQRDAIAGLAFPAADRDSGRRGARLDRWLDRGRRRAAARRATAAGGGCHLGLRAGSAARRARRPATSSAGWPRA